MAINKKIIHFKKKEDFDNEVANGNILDRSIVFIQNSKEISTHGTVYKTVNWSILEPELYEWVDLGLPSGTLWADRNVGATNPENYGLYFQYGDTVGATDTSEKRFGWDDYKLTNDGGSTFVRYNSNDEKVILDLIDDAAFISYSKCKTPTNLEWQELVDNTNLTWTTDYNGATGAIFTSKTDLTKSIFIPASGYALKGNMSEVGSSVYSRTSNVDNTNYANAYRVNITSDGYSSRSGSRRSGYTIRPIKQS